METLPNPPKEETIAYAKPEHLVSAALQQPVVYTAAINVKLKSPVTQNG